MLGRFSFLIPFWAPQPRLFSEWWVTRPKRSLVREADFSLVWFSRSWGVCTNRQVGWRINQVAMTTLPNGPRSLNELVGDFTWSPRGSGYIR